MGKRGVEGKVERGGGKGEGGLEPVKEKQRKYGTGELISAGASIIFPSFLIPSPAGPSWGISHTC